ncbi:MAG: peroxidase-related enzyme, partial [Hyphomicrobiales bacterium]|nr:peroxidase-related enzyme [Hyphomicrobiales bacterium]
PHTMEGHMTLYKYVLHHSANTLDKWYLEAIGVYVSLINKCDYCVEHHFGGLTRLVGDTGRANEMRRALEAGNPGEAFDDRQTAGLDYAQTLTCAAASLTAESIAALRSIGFSDGEILEINQVTAYFNYANRTVLGLGISTDGDILGLSPGNSANPDDWQHG